MATTVDTSKGSPGVVTGLPRLLGYLVGARAGAVAYDLTHTCLPPAVLVLGGVLGGASLAVSAALIWFGDIGMDRALGLGLRYADRPPESHLNA